MRRRRAWGRPLFLVLGVGVALASTSGRTACAEDSVDAAYRALLDAWKQKRYGEVARDAHRFLEAHPDFRYAAAVEYLGGNAALEVQSWEVAERFYRRLVREHPDDKRAGEARNELVTVFDRTGRYEACLAQCRENLALYPGSPRTRRWRFEAGRSLFRLWRFDEAKREIEALLAEHPGRPWEERARALLDRIEPVLDADDSGAVGGYDGKYVEDVRFQREAARLPDLVDEAWKRLDVALGLRPGVRPRVLFTFEDARPGAGGGVEGRTDTVAIEGKPAVRIHLVTEYVVLSPEDYETRVCHEMTHAALRAAMGRSYDALPAWVREGLAVYAAGQMDDRVAAIVSNQVFTGKPLAGLVNGLETRRHDFVDYLEDVLAFDWLEGRRRGAVRDFTARLLGGEDHQAAFSAASDLPFDEAVRAAEQHARERVNEVVGDDGRAYERIRARLFAAAKAGRLVAWLQGPDAVWLRSFVVARPRHALAPNARYRLGRALVETGHGAEGRPMLQHVVDVDLARTSIADDAAYWIARSYEKDGDATKAREAWSVFLRDFAWARQTKEAPPDVKPAGPLRAP